MDGQSSISIGLFLKGLVLALGAMTGILAVVAAIAFGAGLGKLFGKLGQKLKRKPKDQTLYTGKVRT
jgi:hypothetical protein